jgi:hypothetical protein
VSASEDAGVTFWCSVRRAMAMMLPPEEVDGWWRREVGRHLFLPCQSLPATCCGRFFYLLCARQKTLSLLALFAPLSPAVVVCDDGDLEVCLVCYKCMLCMYVSCECARGVPSLARTQQ